MFNDTVSTVDEGKMTMTTMMQTINIPWLARWQ